MPEPIDLTGRRFGRLLVQARAPDVVSASGRSRYAAWACLCDCGQSEVVPGRRLPYCESNAARKDVANACAHCRAQRVCVACGKAFESAQFRACCSDACDVMHRRANDMAHYYRQVARDPDYNRNIRAARRKRAQADPEYAERLAAQSSSSDARKRERIKADPVRQERVRENARARYWRNVEANRAKKRAARARRIEAMTPEQYLRWAERTRRYDALYAARRRATPEGRARYRDYMREYLAQQALRKLFAVGDELIKRRLDHDDESHN